MPPPTTAAEVKAFRRFAHALIAAPDPPASLEECLRRWRGRGGWVPPDASANEGGPPEEEADTSGIGEA